MPATPTPASRRLVSVPNDADSLTGPRAQKDAGTVSDSDEAVVPEFVDRGDEPDDEFAPSLSDAADAGFEDGFGDDLELADAPFMFGDPADFYDGDGFDDDLVVLAPVGPDVYAPDRAPVSDRPVPQLSRSEHRRRVRLQARRVRRIIRHIEPWSVLKISLLFYACLWVIFLVAGFMMWGVAESSGTVGKVESLIQELFALDTFTFDAAQIFRGYALGGLALSIAGTTFNVLMCLLFNLISDLTGGLRITMIEEETARPTPPRRRRRRPSQGRRP